MKKATVIGAPGVEKGFRYHRLDNTSVDVKPGDVIDLDEMGSMERHDRILAGHVKLLPTPAPPENREATVKVPGGFPTEPIDQPKTS